MRLLPLYEEPPRSATDASERLDVDPSCTRCDLHAGARNACLAADGEAGGVLVVGEYPGRVEDAVGRPHAGDGGRVLRNMVAKYWSGPAAYDYAVRCSPGRSEVKPKHVEACRPYLARAVDEVVPQRILAVGSAAAYALFGRSVQARENRRGYAYLFPDGGDPVPVFFLPSYTGAARNRFLRRYFEEDLAWALRCPLPELPPIDGDAVIVETAEDAALAVADLRENSSPDEPASFDVEACGLLFDPSYRVLSLSACGAGESDAWVWDKAALADPGVRAPLLAWLADPDAPKTGTNVKYDENAICTAFGIEVRGVVGDVRLHRKLLAADASGALDKMVEHVGMGGMKEENEAAMEPIVKRVRKGLEVERRLAKQREENEALVRAGSAPKKERALSPEAQAGLAELRRIDREMPHLARLVRDPDVAWQAWAYALVPGDVLTRYNARDVVGTDRVRAWVAPQLRAEPDIDAVRAAIVDRAAHAVRKVEGWGIAVDRAALDAFDAYLAAQLVPIRARLDVMAGPDFNPLSPPQCGELLFGKLGLRHDKKTKSGQQSTDGQVLEDLAGKHPVANAILEYRTIAKMRGTYASGMIPHIRADGRIHTSILLDGAASGRSSSQDPNLQNLPRAKDSAEGKMARDCFVARPGFLLLECLVPGTRVLTADLRWVPIETLAVGDELVGFDEHLNGRECKFKPAVVEATGKLTKPCYRIVTDRGTVVASENHLWVTRKPFGTRRWTRTDELLVGDSISFFADPWDVDTSWEGGYLAGLFDGEGWVSGGGVGFGQNDGLVLDQACAMLRARGFDLSLSKNKQGCNRVTTNGEKTGLRLLGMLRPSRLMRTSRSLWEGRQTWGKRSRPARILSVEPVGMQPVIAVKTSTATFIAEGFLSHNCDYSQLELRVAAMLSRDPLMRQIFAAGLDYHQRTAELISQVAWGIPPSAVTEVHRTRAKAVNFGILYGKTARTLAKEWGIAVAAAEKIVNAIMGQFKVLAAWCEDQLAELRKTGEIWTWWAGRRARRRPLWRVADPEDGVRKNAENSAVNTPVQGTASEFCVASLADVVEWVEGDGIAEDCRPVLPIHDALVLEVRRELVVEAAETTRDIMLSHDSDGVPLDVDAKVGRAFGSMVKFPVGDHAGCRAVLDKLAA